MSISPIILKTDDVAKTLKETAYKYKVPTAKLDFKLLDFQTMVQTPENRDWLELNEETEKYVSEEVRIKQMYEIEVFSAKPSALFKNVKFSIGANKERSKVVVLFQKGSKFKYSQKAEDLIREEIEKRMLKSGYLIRLWDKKENLDRLFAKIKVSGAFIFKQKMQLVLSECVASEPSVDDALDMCYEKKVNNIDRFDRMDYSKRGYALGVAEGEVIIEYTKPKQGINGRNCKGELIKAHEPTENHKPEFGITDRIKTEEDEDKIQYIAAESGYVIFQDGKFDISDELEVEEINFKKTGSIETGIDKDVKLNVKEKNEFADAIGTGMTVEAQEVRVEGSVASSAIVRGQTVKIGGQTHQTSKVYGSDVDINVHKGYVKGEKVHVTRLERGIIEGDEVSVGQVIGGEIRAKKVNVEIVNSNTKIYAADMIHLEHIKGEDNIFTIDPMVIEAFREEVEKITETIERLEDEKERIEETYEKKRKFYERSRTSANQIKQHLADYKKRGVKPPATFVHKLKQYQALNDEINSLNADITLYANDIADKYTELDTRQATVFNARIVNEGSWVGHNEIVFKLISPPLEYRELPKGSGKKHRIVEIDEEEYKIIDEDISESV